MNREIKDMAIPNKVLLDMLEERYELLNAEKIDAMRFYHNGVITGFRCALLTQGYTLEELDKYKKT